MRGERFGYSVLGRTNQPWRTRTAVLYFYSVSQPAKKRFSTWSDLVKRHGHTSSVLGGTTAVESAYLVHHTWYVHTRTGLFAA